MKVNFLIAEEIRPELGGKLTLIGFYPGDVIIMNKGKRAEEGTEDLPSGFERLAILAIITDAPDGVHKFRGRIIDPSGSLSRPEATIGEATTKKGYSHSVLIEIKPFVVTHIGIYRFEFFVDDVMFTFPFEIREQFQPAD